MPQRTGITIKIKKLIRGITAIKKIKTKNGKGGDHNKARLKTPKKVVMLDHIETAKPQHQPQK
jgi:hypothetical protein